jgi:branched-chain amino acid transport system substrate-binding protein
MNGLVLRSLALTGLALALIAPAAPAGAADPYNIDVILNLTGPGTFLGKAEELSISLLEKRINASGGIKGRPVHFVIHDDQTQPSTTIQLMTQSIADKAPVVLGSSLAANCLATFPLVKAGPVQYCYSPSVYPPAGTFGFTSGTATKDVALAYVRFFRSKGWKRMAMISSTDASGQDADESFAQALALPENSISAVATSACSRKSPRSNRRIRKCSSPTRPAHRSARCSRGSSRPASRCLS